VLCNTPFLRFSKTPRYAWGSGQLLAVQKAPLSYRIKMATNHFIQIEGGEIHMDIMSLAHTSWRCNYHIVFAPKYRRRLIYGELRTDIGKILRNLCERKGVEIVEANACVDHIHMLVKIPPKLSVSAFMGYLKGKSSLIIFERHAQLKYKYGNRKFWCKGYFVDTVGRNKKAIQEYIQQQMQEDMVEDQLTLFEEYDPFTGKKNKR
jgi:putative transposase